MQRKQHPAIPVSSLSPMPNMPSIPFPAQKAPTRDELFGKLAELYWEISELYHKLKPILEPQIELYSRKCARKEKLREQEMAARDAIEDELDAEYVRNMIRKK